MTPAVVRRSPSPCDGSCAIEADIGLALATQRQEVFQTLTDGRPVNEALAPDIADIGMKMGDVPGVDEISKRLRATVPTASRPCLRT